VVQPAHAALAVRIALRTQQVIAHETGVANTINPVGGRTSSRR
jgi:methylmalonyl-CoA mutase N-terminal domain/subunit